jgi:L-ascorbate metabolism protein UlaG (beta-lactamase superfamily)
MSKRLSPEAVVAQIELKGWLGQQGAKLDEKPGANKGGTVEAAGCKFTLTNAFHSSSAEDGTYTGEACGVVVELEDGTKVYFAGDTCVFGDMQLIGRIYEPDVAVIPIGDHFTMDPREAAVALELLGTKRCVPCHYGTFPVLTGTREELERLAPDADIAKIDPGQSVDL